MKRIIVWLLGLPLVLAFSGFAWAGDLTTNEFFYKPSLGARGAQEKGSFDAGLDRADARLAKEIWVGDPGYGSTIQDAIAAIGSNNAILRVPVGTYNIVADLMVPGNITLRVERGAILSIANGKTLSISGGLEAGLHQIFSCTGTGKVVFGSNATEKHFPEWWGAVGDGVADDAAALQAMVTAVPDGGKLDFNQTYKSNSKITISGKSDLRFSGPGKFIMGLSNDDLIFVSGSQNICFDGLRFSGNYSASGYGPDIIEFNCTNCGQVVNCYFAGHRGGSAIHKNGWDNIEIANNTFNDICGAADPKCNFPAIKLQNGSHATVTGNIMVAVGGGIQAVDWQHANINGNNITLKSVSAPEAMGTGGIHIINSNGSTTCEDVAITGNSVRYEGAPEYNFGILLEAKTNADGVRCCSVTGNTIFGTYWGISLDTSDEFISPNGPKECVIAENTLRNIHDGAILLNHRSDCNVISNNFVENSSGILLLASSNDLVQGNYQKNCTAIYLAPQGSYSSANNSVIGNKASGGATGIFVDANCNNNLIAGNHLSGSTSLYDCGITLTGCSYNKVVNNYIANYAKYGIQLYTGATYNTLQGNTAIDTQAVPTQLRGIYIIDSNCTGNSIIGNVAYGNTEYQIYDNGSSEISQNRLHKDSALYGSFTMAAAATKVVSNGNVLSGSRVKLTPTNAAAAALMGGAKSLYINARTAGANFSVATADGSSAAGTETFDYALE